YKRFDECEKTSHKDWDITIDEYFYETKKFCCFIWQTMDCEIDIAKQCNQIYSQRLEKNTIKTYQTLCNHIGYGHGSWSCWWTNERQANAGSIIGIAIVILLMFCFVYSLYQYKNYQMKKLDTSTVGQPTQPAPRSQTPPPLATPPPTPPQTPLPLTPPPTPPQTPLPLTPPPTPPQTPLPVIAEGNIPPLPQPTLITEPNGIVDKIFRYNVMHRNP
uniref:Uncharacterized protein LOC113794863 n=1 Tax=Dermatophagoides pteronyssinus TaxID=6956 RepID=A0A6P6Y5P9_DERPT